MSERNPLLTELTDSREQFLALVAELRPELHRYCARMLGSTAQGEDIVQEVLAQAYFALPEFEVMPPLRPWLFRIAHHRALDALRRYDRRKGQPLDDVEEITAGTELDPEAALAHEQALRTALSRFLELPPFPRSAVILKDVLGNSLDEIAALLEASLPAVKAALHRGRARLREAPFESESQPRGPAPPELIRYATLFNARDWDGVRALLAADVELDLVSRARRSGPAVGSYLINYELRSDWHMVPAWLESRPVLAVFRAAADDAPSYFIELEFRAGRVAKIQDFRYVPYILQEASLSMEEARRPLS